MKDKNTDFPLYRKMIGAQVFYKVLNAREMEEILKMGSKLKFFMIEAKQYPEILKIADVIASAYPYESIEAEAYEKLRELL